ncbi:MAG: glycosyltransferase family 4 protein [Nitrospira sp.]|nr:glycosyltransferase family 4 protein [Nitrospira sp.]TKB75903.1 MAG: glycosyltransferase family 4 protein [Nitrospira sp.]
MRKVLIIIDKFGWSYDAIVKGLTKGHTDGALSFDIVSLADNLDYIERHHTQYDLVFAVGWTLVMSKKRKHRYRQELTFLDRRKLITGIHSHRSWDEYASLPEACPPPPLELIEELSTLRHINVISRRLFDIFREAGLTNITLTENGVDTDLFVPTHPITTDRHRPLIVGFCGSTHIDKHDHLKGYSQFIAPLRELPNVEIKVLGGKGEGQVKREEMPQLYNQIDLYICASTSEGFSQSVLEASACGRGVISTRVGGCEDLITEGHNGFFIGRDLPGIKRLVTQLEADRLLVQQLGGNNRKRVLERYAWAIQGPVWLEFIQSNLPEPVGA